MMYTVTSTERTRSKASSFETKALLYLAGFHPDSDKIEYYVIDLFNDITGTTRFDDEIWDIQSKSTVKQSPRVLGENLVTLYKNYLSEFDFSHFILFIGGVSSSVCLDPDLKTFSVDNIKEKAKVDMISGLMDESIKKEYIDDRLVSKSSVEAFLQHVLFVVGDREEIDYIRQLIKVHPKIIPDEIKLKAIFEEIRSAQSAKKDSSEVEGKQLVSFSDYKQFNRHISFAEIRILILHRILDYNFSDPSIPSPFIPIVRSLSDWDRKLIIDECQANISRTLFDNQNAKHFWAFFDNICQTVIKNPKDDVQQLYEKINQSKLQKNKHLDVYSAKYFIAIVKDGLCVY